MADYVVSEAQRLKNLPADGEGRTRLRAERRRIKDSADPLDRLIAERMLLDAEAAQKPH